jgi:hypothetical protein
MRLHLAIPTALILISAIPFAQSTPPIRTSRASTIPIVASAIDKLASHVEQATALVR